MTVLGVIPARGGSKGIPGKNLVLVAGKPLVAWTCEAALESDILTDVVVTSDDERIARAAREHGVENIVARPASLAADDTPMLPVLRHAVTEFEGWRGPVDVVVLLQPTSPLRRGAHIDAAVRLLQGSGADSVVSVVEVPHHFTPASLMSLDSGRLSPYGGGTTAVRRQDKPVLYARNGPAVLAMRRGALTAFDSLYAGDCRPLIMRPEESIDVDTHWDLALAAFALGQR